MERIIFGKKSLNTNRHRIDRFIPSRETLNSTERRHSWFADCNSFTNNVDIWYSKYLQRKKYTNYLDEAFGLEPDSKYYISSDREPSWPCVPRKKSYLSSADSILDLPTYSFAVFPELLDWSNKNILVAALGKNYYKWSWEGQTLISQGVSPYKIHTCKFDPQGDLLALGMEMQALDIHDNEMNKKISGNCCRCNQMVDNMCLITALDWSPTGNSCTTGCSLGAVSSFSRNAEIISCRRLFNKPILAVRVAPNARYVAVTCVNGSSVIVLTWPSLEFFSCFQTVWTIKAIAWHPWRTAFLAVGCVTSDLQAHITLWNTPTGKIKESTLSCKRYNLEAMLFSHRTGEMVLSLCDIDRGVINQRNSAQLVVLSDPETVVDKWGDGRAGLDCVRTMVFSPDGTKLATATLDEDLIIWNFLPEDNSKNKRNSSRFSALPVYLDKADHGFSLR